MVSVCGTNRRRVYAPGHCSDFSRTRETAQSAPRLCQRRNDHLLFATCQPQFPQLRYRHFRFDHAKNDNANNMIGGRHNGGDRPRAAFHSRKSWRRAQLIFSASFSLVGAPARPMHDPSREVEESVGSRLRFHLSVSELLRVHPASQIPHWVPIPDA